MPKLGKNAVLILATIDHFPFTSPTTRTDKASGAGRGKLRLHPRTHDAAQRPDTNHGHHRGGGEAHQAVAGAGMSSLCLFGGVKAWTS